MKSNISKKALVIGLCLILVIMTLSMSIMMSNIFHSSHCSTAQCSLCAFIHLSKEYINNIFFINSSILIAIVCVPPMQLILRCIQKNKNLNLVELKVVQNN